MNTLDQRIRENSCLPANSVGQIVSPRYLPVGSSHLSVWRQWLGANPKSQWPKWLISDIQTMRKLGQRSTPLLPRPIADE